MVEKELVVKIDPGLQARPAAKFVQEANRFSSDIYLEKGGKQVNAKSIMGVMSLAIGMDEVVGLQADGPDEDEAMEKLSQFITEEL